MTDIEEETEATPPAEPTLGELAASLERANHAVDEHEQLLHELLEFLSARPDGPWTWRTLTGERREQLWIELYDWVGWLDARYLRYLGEDYRIVEQWYRHPVLVELLTALMVSHHAAYQGAKTPPSFDLVEWHERCLWPTFARIKALKLLPSKTPERGEWDGPVALPTHENDEPFSEFSSEDVRLHPDAGREDGND